MDFYIQAHNKVRKLQKKKKKKLTHRTSATRQLKQWSFELFGTRQYFWNFAYMFIRGIWARRFIHCLIVFEKSFKRFKGQLHSLFFNEISYVLLYNIQNTGKPYLFSLIQTQIKIVRKFYVLLHVNWFNE